MHLHTAGAVCHWDSWFSCNKGPNASTGVQYAYIPGDAVEFQHIRGSPRCERRVKVPLNERQRMHLYTASACLPLGQLVKLQKGSKCEYGVQYASIPGGAAQFLHIRGFPRCDRSRKMPLNERQRMHLHTAGACLPLEQLV